MKRLFYPVILRPKAEESHGISAKHEILRFAQDDVS